MKRIAFLITCHGSDGRGPESVVEAFWDETKRDNAFKDDPNNCYYSKSERIVDVEEAYKAAINRRTSIDKLVIDTVENKEEL